MKFLIIIRITLFVKMNEIMDAWEVAEAIYYYVDRESVSSVPVRSF